MKIYVINLERSVERREKMSRMLTAAKLEFEIFSAVDGSSDFKELERYNQKNVAFCEDVL